MTNELIIMLNGAEHGCVLHKNKKKSNWTKKDLKKAAKRGYVCGYDSTSNGNAYFVFPMDALTSMTICEGGIPQSGVVSTKTDDESVEEFDPDYQPYETPEQEGVDPNYA